MSPPLNDTHRALLESSSISPEVVAQRGYFTASKPQDLAALGFAGYQQTVPALVIPTRDMAGEIVGHQIRPDNPRVNGKGRIKYETPDRAQICFDVPTFTRLHIKDTTKAIWITEGARKVDALVSAGQLAIGIPGVWSWKARTSPVTAEVHPDLLALRGYLDKRQVVIAYDADAMTNSAVHEAMRQLGAWLEHEGASVLYVKLPKVKGDPKTGVDDFLAAGGTVDQLWSSYILSELPKLKTPEERFGKPGGQKELRSPMSLRSQPEWPMPMGEDAYHGVIGSIVRKVEPHTEADLHAVLLQLVVLVGNAAGRLPHARVEADRHGTNLYLALVGNTSSGRKGTSYGQARRPIALADTTWAETREVSGLSSGEGVIYAVRDPEFKTKIVKTDDGEEERLIPVDPGVEDKRLIVSESEFASALKVARREGNTLSALIRQAYDGKSLQTLTRNSPLKASAPHISIIAHITPDELRRELPASEHANGYANRFLFALVRRSKLLPFGGDIESVDFSDEIGQIKSALADSKFKRARAIPWDADARELWTKTYAELVAERPGQLGNLLARAPSHVLRISLIYALLDRSATIKAVHLRAALAVWTYIEQSTAIIFQTATGDPLADRLHQRLLDAGDGLTRTEIRDLFDRHRTGGEIDTALKALHAAGLATKATEATKGRSAERWHAVRTATEETKATEGQAA